MNDIEAITKVSTGDMAQFDAVDDIVARSIVIGDPLLAFEYGSGLITSSKIKSYALAKLLFKLRQQWALFRQSDDLATMAEVHLGVRPTTTDKYINMWEAIFENDDIDDETKRLLAGRNIADTLLLTAAARDGSLSSDEMREAAMSPDRTTLREIIREKRGEKTSSGTAVRLFVAMRDNSRRKAGTIFVKRGEIYEDIAILLPTNSDVAEQGRNALLNGRKVEEVY